VPFGESEQALAAARARGIPAELLAFAGEGHELLTRANRQRFVEHTVSWLRERLCPR